MKKLTSYNRIAGYLNHIFDLLNEEFFDNVLPKPVITIQSTPKAYGHFCLNSRAWVDNKDEGYFEINLGAGTIARSIEFVVTTLLHEALHLYHFAVVKCQDTSRGGYYHNRIFRDACLARGLEVEHSTKYGWSHTKPGDRILEFVLKNDLTDILISRNEFTAYRPVGGAGSHEGSGVVLPTKTTSNSRKYVCPCCGMSVRATRVVRVACIDCGNQEMVLANNL